MTQPLAIVHARGTAMLKSALGPAIAAWLDEPNVAEVMLNADGRLWVDRLDSGMLRTEERLSPMQAERIIRLVAHHVGAEVHRGSPRVSAELPEGGERFEGLLPPVVTEPVFSIRRPASLPLALADYVAAGTMTATAAAYLAQAVQTRANILVAGGTSTGKTTLTNALLAVASSGQDRIILIEDTRELRCDAANVVALRTAPGVTMTDLVRSSLRLRPDRIPIGEVRGPEALDLLKACHILVELVADELRRLIAAVREQIPDLLLTRMIVAEGEGHQVIKRHIAGRVYLVQLRRDRGELETLLHDGGRHAEMRCDRLFAFALIAQALHAAKLVERMQRFAEGVLGERVFFGEHGIVGRLDHARDRDRRRGALALHDQFDRKIAPAAGRDLEHAGLVAVLVKLGTDIQAGDQATTLDVVGKIGDRHAELDAADVRLGQDQLVERDVPRLIEADLGKGFRHDTHSMTGRRETLSRLSNPS